MIAVSREVNFKSLIEDEEYRFLTGVFSMGGTILRRERREEAVEKGEGVIVEAEMNGVAEEAEELMVEGLLVVEEDEEDEATVLLIDVAESMVVLIEVEEEGAVAEEESMEVEVFVLLIRDDSGVVMDCA